MSNSTEPDSGADVNAFLFTAVINVVSAVFVLALFLIVRPRFKWVYSPRDNAPEFPLGYFAWIPFVLQLPIETVCERVGLDAYMFISFITFSFKFFSVCSVYGIILILVNATGGNGEIGFGIISIANIESGSPALWAHLIGCYFFTFSCFYFVKGVYVDYTSHRHQFLKTRSISSRSVLVNNIPPEARDEKQIKEFFIRIFGDAVSSVAVGNYNEELIKLVTERDNATSKLEVALATFAEKGVRPCHKVKPCVGPKADSITHWTNKISELNEKIALSKKSDVAPSPSAFVTFNSNRAASESASCSLDDTPGAWSCTLAPEPRDVYWPNLGVGHWDGIARTTVANAVVIALIFLWTIPVTAVSAFTTLPYLLGLIPSGAFHDSFEDFLFSFPAVVAFLQGFLPTLATLIFLAILPIILKMIAKFEGIQATSWIEQRVSRWFFLFCMFNFFLAMTVSGTLLSSISSIATISDLIDMLANALPAYSFFFCMLIMTKTFGGLPFVLLDVGTLVISNIFKKLALTKRQIDAAEKVAPMAYWSWYPNHMLVFIIAISYSAIAPVVIIFAVLYFAFALLVFKYKLLYVHDTPYESGGEFWPDMFAEICVSLLVFQLTTLGVLGLKQSPVTSALMIPLIIFTAAFYKYIESSYAVVARNLPLVLAAEDEDGKYGAAGSTSPLALRDADEPQKTVEGSAYVEEHLLAPTQAVAPEEGSLVKQGKYYVLKDQEEKELETTVRV